jgi:hypothetical protein
MLLSLPLNFVFCCFGVILTSLQFQEFVVESNPLDILSVMATVTSNLSAGGANSPIQSGPTPNPSGTKQGKAVVPTNHVTTKDGVTVRARIDPTLAVEDVIRQLCLNLKLKDPPAMFSLRDEDDTLVTTENLNKMIKSRANLKCVRAFFSCGTYACVIYANIPHPPSSPVSQAGEFLRDRGGRYNRKIEPARG